MLFLNIVGLTAFNISNICNKYSVGQEIDNLNGVSVYYNGRVRNFEGRNVTKNGYNLGMKYQCIEFVKRYYFEYLNHEMPDSYGHSKDFFDRNIADGQLNQTRNLMQYKNQSDMKPAVNDILVFDGTFFNKSGHVAIISNVSDDEIEIIQQNSGLFGKSRERLQLQASDGKWEVKNKRILGWLRKK